MSHLGRVCELRHPSISGSIATTWFASGVNYDFLDYHKCSHGIWKQQANKCSQWIVPQLNSNIASMRSSTWCWWLSLTKTPGLSSPSSQSVIDASSALLVTANTITSNTMVLTRYIHTHMVYEQINEVLTWKNRTRA